MNHKRCAWCGNDPLYVAYHDEEWGLSVHDDIKLFEMLVLDGAQAGLSWLTILRKREHYRRAFDNFDPRQVAGYDADRVNQLLLSPSCLPVSQQLVQRSVHAKNLHTLRIGNDLLQRYLGIMSAHRSLSLRGALHPESIG